MFYNEKGDEFLPNLTKNEEVSKQIITNDRGQKVVETKQYLNTDVVNKKRESLMNTTLGVIDGEKTNEQAQNTYLDDLAIVDDKGVPVSSKDWQKLDSITKQKYVYSSVDKTWFDETKVKEVVPGDPTGGYYRSTFSKPIVEEKKGKKIGSAEQTLIDLKEDITTQFAQDIPIEKAVDLALNLGDDVVFTQNGFTIDLGEDEDAIIEEGKPAKRKLKSYAYNSDDPIKNKEAQNKLIDLVRKKYFSGQGGYINAAKLVKDLLKKYKAKTN